MGHAFWLSYLDEWPLSLVICRLYKEINLLPSSSSIRAWFCWFLAQTLHMRLIIFLGSDLAYEAHYNLSPQQKKLHFRSFQWKDQIIARSRGIGGKGNFHLPALPFSLPGLQWLMHLLIGGVHPTCSRGYANDTRLTVSSQRIWGWNFSGFKYFKTYHDKVAYEQSWGKKKATNLILLLSDNYILAVSRENFQPRGKSLLLWC